jgi:6-phosphogluconate dehydrogenase
MGENLALNIERNGFTVAVFNRTVTKVDDFLNGRGRDKRFIGVRSLADWGDRLERPRKVMLMVKAGAAVDVCIEQLRPHLAPGDIIIDGGNAHYGDSERRWGALEAQGLRFVGTGVSGGEEGALRGRQSCRADLPTPGHSLSPSSRRSRPAPPMANPAAIGSVREGLATFVKMVHNGIEYGDMQLICEAYHLMRDGLGHGAG